MMSDYEKIKKKLASLNKGHPPSYGRGLKRTAKYVISRKEDITPIIHLAMEMDDKYYRADTLVNISLMMAVEKIPGSHQLFLESLESIKAVSPIWRQMEAFENLIKMMEKAGDFDFSRIMEFIHTIYDSRHRMDMAKKALRIVIKGEKTDISQITEWVSRIGPVAERARIRGYVGETLYKMGGSRGKAQGKEIILEALDDTKGLRDQKVRVPVLMDLVDVFERSGERDFGPLFNMVNRISDKKSKAELLGKMAGKMHKLGIPGFEEVFQEAIKLAQGIPDKEVRMKIIEKFGRGMIKAGIGAPAAGKEKVGNSSEFSSSGPSLAPFIPSGLNISIGLYNTYDTRIHKAHLKAVERAGTMCHTLGIPMVLLDFPLENITVLTDAMEKDPSLKNSVSIIRSLLEAQALSIVNLKDSKSPGKIVATTCRPREDKKIEMGAVLNSKERLCIVLGLGRKGLPIEFLDSADYHLEFTGRDIPLETCAAIGVLGGKILGRLTRNQQSF